MSLRQIQRYLYFGQRTAGDLAAAQRGPLVLGKRLVRRSITRRAFALVRNGRS